MIEQASIHVNTVGERSVVEVAGELDLATSPALREAIDSVLEEGHPDLIVDLGGVTFMDSSAINVLAAAAKRLGPSEVRIAGCRPNLLRLFELSGLDAVLRMYDTVGAALGDAP